MKLADVNHDLNERVVVNTTEMQWQASPSDSVWRKPLYRKGGEFGQATSIVRYDAGGNFHTHQHPQGEEILVLDGVLSDERGNYPMGTYLLNPAGSEHAPGSEQGCTLFVRLRQYTGDDRPRHVINTFERPWMPGIVNGLSVKPLYQQQGYPDQMALVKWEPGTRFPHHAHPGGEEIFVLEGTFEDEHGIYPAGTWIRGPHMSEHRPFSRFGCVIYVRVGGLPGEIPEHVVPMSTISGYDPR